MALFGSLLGDFPDDPIFGSQIRHMDNMINSLFSDPFGMMGHHAAIADANHRAARHPVTALQPMFFGGFPAMPNMNRLFADFENMAANPTDSHSFCSNSMMTMSSGPDGRPQVYQETMSTTSGPGGVRQTQKTVCDSRTGTKKMAIGHHIGERGHIMERAQNMYSGEQEESQEFINIEEDDAESFTQEWQQRSRRGMGAIGGRGNYDSYGGHSRNRPEHRQLALPDPASASRQTSSPKWTPSSRRSVRPSPTTKPPNAYHTASSSSSSGSTKKPAAVKAPVASSSATVTTANRKREHTPDSTKVRKKRPAVPDSNV